MNLRASETVHLTASQSQRSLVYDQSKKPDYVVVSPLGETIVTNQMTNTNQK